MGKIKRKIRKIEEFGLSSIVDSSIDWKLLFPMMLLVSSVFL